MQINHQTAVSGLYCTGNDEIDVIDASVLVRCIVYLFIDLQGHLSFGASGNVICDLLCRCISVRLVSQKSGQF